MELNLSSAEAKFLLGLLERAEEDALNSDHKNRDHLKMIMGLNDRVKSALSSKNISYSSQWDR